MSALSSLQREIESLSQRLQEVELERDNLKRSMRNNGTRSSTNTLDSNLHEESGLSNDELELQCQRYEERMVELHSVIAELTRKLQSQEEDVIREESEFEDTQSIVTDSCDEDGEANGDEDEDYNSLAFERDLERNAPFRHHRNPGGVSRNSRIYGSSSSDSFSAERADYEAEISRLHEKIKVSQEESQKLTDELCERERHLAEQQLVIDQLQLERDAFKRQVEDIKTTVEYQEARMDRRSAHALGASTGSPLHSTSSGRSSSERRSLRRKRHDKHAAISGVLSGPSTRESTPMSSCSREPLRNTNKVRQLFCFDVTVFDFGHEQRGRSVAQKGFSQAYSELGTRINSFLFRSWDVLVRLESVSYFVPEIKILSIHLGWHLGKQTVPKLSMVNS